MVEPRPPENPSRRFPDALSTFRRDASAFSLMNGSNARLNLAVTNGKKQALDATRKQSESERDGWCGTDLQNTACLTTTLPRFSLHLTQIFDLSNFGRPGMVSTEAWVMTKTSYGALHRLFRMPQDYRKTLLFRGLKGLVCEILRSEVPK